MKKLKILTIFGTRPEAIKMAPLIKELAKNSQIESRICVTAQHREMLDQVLKLFNINPDYDFNIMKSKQTLTKITNKVLLGLEELFNNYKPDIVLVHGDTTTTFAASLAAFYKKIKIGHVEAGLRTFDKYFPYPEEMNRTLAGVLADIHFCPTKLSKENLLREGVNENKIFVTGNTVIDAMASTLNINYVFKTDELNTIDFQKRKVIMVTAHRRENWGENMENICKSLKYIVKNNKYVEIIYLVHLNPIVKNVIEKHLINMERVHLLPPLDISETHNLINKSYLIMTDSGGIQEESPHLGKPVLVLRDVTERPEAVQAGTVKLVGTNFNSIVKNTEELLHNKEIYFKMSNAVNPYGDGKASERIVKSLLYYFGLSEYKAEEFNSSYF